LNDPAELELARLVEAERERPDPSPEQAARVVAGIAHRIRAPHGGVGGSFPRWGAGLLVAAVGAAAGYGAAVLRANDSWPAPVESVAFDSPSAVGTLDQAEPKLGSREPSSKLVDERGPGSSRVASEDGNEQEASRREESALVEPGPEPRAEKHSERSAPSETARPVSITANPDEERPHRALARPRGNLTRAPLQSQPPEAIPGIDREQSPVDRLEDELALIEAARTALSKGDADLALERSRSHQSAFPTGVLREEAIALEVAALCVDGRDTAAPAAERFERDWPRSVHGELVRRYCKSVR